MQKKLQKDTASTTWVENEEPPPLRSWRKRVLNRIIRVSAIMNMISLILQYQVIEYKPTLFQHAVVWGSGLLGLAIAFLPFFTDRFRGWILVVLIYLGAVHQFYFYGLASSSLLLLLALPPLALILLGRRAGVFFTATSLVIFIAFLVLKLSPIHIPIQESIRTIHSLSSWLEIGITFVVLHGFVFFLIHRFYHLTVDNAREAVERALEARQGKLATIFALADLAEHRDEDTGLHLFRVAEYSWILSSEYARSRGYDIDPFSENIRESSMLHDIGKVGIPDELLLKPGRLTKEEFEIMKTHTSIGANHLKKLDERYPGNPFLHTAMEIAESHHENWDGSGYPTGLRNESIPISARIVAIADSYDTITSRRPYQEARSHEEAVQSIQEQSGIRYDPELVQIFLEKADQFRTVHEQSR